MSHLLDEEEEPQKFSATALGVSDVVAVIVVVVVAVVVDVVAAVVVDAVAADGSHAIVVFMDVVVRYRKHGSVLGLSR